MLVPCEIAVKSVIPAIRAHVAKELTQTHKMKQTDVAGLLGITQTAVSKYVRHVRGRVIALDQTNGIQNTLNELASNVAKERISGPRLIRRLCEVCAVIRKNGLMCELCKRSDSNLEISLCNVCKNGEPCANPPRSS